MGDLCCFGIDFDRGYNNNVDDIKEISSLSLAKLIETNRN